MNLFGSYEWNIAESTMGNSSVVIGFKAGESGSSIGRDIHAVCAPEEGGSHIETFKSCDWMDGCVHGKSAGNSEKRFI